MHKPSTLLFFIATLGMANFAFSATIPPKLICPVVNVSSFVGYAKAYMNGTTHKGKYLFEYLWNEQQAVKLLQTKTKNTNVTVLLNGTYAIHHRLTDYPSNCIYDLVQKTAKKGAKSTPIARFELTAKK
ncbi:MAG: hypothetical protein HYX35_00060 [Proteobacteria bacterium]|nr:hypothetical protein [Pseudomonadota bacterium]